MRSSQVLRLVTVVAGSNDGGSHISGRGGVPQRRLDALRCEWECCSQRRHRLRGDLRRRAVRLARSCPSLRKRSPGIIKAATVSPVPRRFAPRLCGGGLGVEARFTLHLSVSVMLAGFRSRRINMPMSDTPLSRPAIREDDEKNVPGRLRAARSRVVGCGSRGWIVFSDPKQGDRGREG
jgi:hypothetical protein